MSRPRPCPTCGRPDNLQTLSVDEAAGLIGSSPSWLAAQVRRGQLPHLRVGRAIRFTTADVQAAIDLLHHDVSVDEQARLRSGQTARSWAYHQKHRPQR